MERMTPSALDRLVPASARSEQERRVGALYRPEWNPLERPMPLVQISGEWLASAGFAPGDEIRVIAGEGRLLVVRRELDVVLDPMWED